MIEFIVSLTAVEALSEPFTFHGDPIMGSLWACATLFLLIGVVVQARSMMSLMEPHRDLDGPRLARLFIGLAFSAAGTGMIAGLLGFHLLGW